MNGRRFLSISVLGLVTIAGYGTWFYSFGVLLDPILDDTGWSEATLTAAFGIGAALGGILSIPAGRTLDRIGSKPIFATAALVTTAGLWVGTLATSVLVFAAATSVAAAAFSALTFYHITQPTSVRVAPDDATRAIAILTIYGAVSSTIYLPAAAWIVGRWGWRAGLRGMALVAAAVLVLAVATVRETETRPDTPSRGAIGDALRIPEVRRFAAAWTTMGIAVGIVLVYQVPLMTAAGLPLTTAAFLAGLRGAAQITGRIPLTPMVRKLGARASMRLAYGATIVGVAVLVVADSVVLGIVYAALAGFGIGAASPLVGVYADTEFDRARMGGFMGFLAATGAVATAVGPALAGAIAEATGERRWAALIALAAGGAAFLLLHPTRAERADRDQHVDRPASS